LLRLLAGADSPTAGTIERTTSVGYCPQEAALYPNLTPAEHFRLFGAAGGLVGQALFEASAALVETFRLSAHVHRPLRVLSGGTCQKVNLALALLHDPELLLLDEPYNGFERDTYRHFLVWVDAARARRRGILLITHLLLDSTGVDVTLCLRDGVLEPGDA
jgi:ABC-type multidrug transport system ATPase subunit